MNAPAAPNLSPAEGAKPDKIAYRKPQPWGMSPDMVVKDVLTADERLWAPLAPDIWSRPLHLNPGAGFYVHLLRVRRSGVLQRHRHSGQVHAYVIKGKWYYLEHDWVADEGSYIFEPPGETHTLTVPDDCSEMITLFTVHGSLMYVDPDGNSIGYDDVFTRMDKYPRALRVRRTRRRLREDLHALNPHGRATRNRARASSRRQRPPAAGRARYPRRRGNDVHQAFARRCARGHGRRHGVRPGQGDQGRGHLRPHRPARRRRLQCLLPRHQVRDRHDQRARRHRGLQDQADLRRRAVQGRCRHQRDRAPAEPGEGRPDHGRVLQRPLRADGAEGRCRQEVHVGQRLRRFGGVQGQEPPAMCFAPQVHSDQFGEASCTFLERAGEGQVRQGAEGLQGGDHLRRRSLRRPAWPVRQRAGAARSYGMQVVPEGRLCRHRARPLPAGHQAASAPGRT